MSLFSETRPSAPADFNMTTRDGLIPIDRTEFRGLQSPAPGLELTLSDAEGNSCEGTIVEVGPRIIRVRLDSATWKAGPIRLEPRFASPRGSAATPAAATTINGVPTSLSNGNATETVAMRRVAAR